MSGIQITGVPGKNIEGVRLDNIRFIFRGGGTAEEAAQMPKELDKGYPEPSKVGVMSAYGVFARHVSDLELANVNMSLEQSDMRPAIVCADVKGLEIDNFKAPTASGVAPAHFTDVTGLSIRNSPGFQ